MTPQRPTQPPTPGTGEHQALALLADRLTQAGFEASVEPEPAFPLLFVPVPGTRALREMVLVSGHEYVWNAGQARCSLDDPAGAAAVLARHIADVGDRFAPPADRHWPPASPDTEPR